LALLSSEGRDLLISLVALAAILLRGAQLLGWLRLVIPSRHATFLALLALASCGGEYWFTGNFISAAIHLVGLMSFLVTIRATTPRDFFFVKLVTFFPVARGLDLEHRTDLCRLAAELRRLCDLDAGGGRDRQTAEGG
jgi:hypothetical protein